MVRPVLFYGNPSTRKPGISRNKDVLEEAIAHFKPEMPYGKPVAGRPGVTCGSFRDGPLQIPDHLVKHVNRTTSPFQQSRRSVPAPIRHVVKRATEAPASWRLTPGVIPDRLQGCHQAWRLHDMVRQEGVVHRGRVRWGLERLDWATEADCISQAKI